MPRHCPLSSRPQQHLLIFGHFLGSIQEGLHVEQFRVIVSPFVLVVIFAQGHFHQGHGRVGRDHPPRLVLYSQGKVGAAIQGGQWTPLPEGSAPG